jgi:S1-C subfamily serine protease
LDATVTAGIVSAKSRSIDINSKQSKTPIESFIQTDAAVNPGNSGGALINTAGELIGINSAIASPTGSYAGYSYAIPVNIVKKVVNDILKFGTVQRAFLGIQYAPEGISEEEKVKQGIKDGEGVYVMEVPKGGAADVAGVKKGDFITKINGVGVTTGPEMVEQVARYKPSDKITLTYKRDGKENTVNLILKNKSGNTDVVKIENILDKLGADLENLDKKIAANNEIAGGVTVKKLKEGGLLKKTTKVQDGFVITSVNDVEIKNMEDLKTALTAAKGGNVRLMGIYPGFQGTYAYPLNLGEE